MRNVEFVPVTEARKRLLELIKGLPDRNVLLLKHGRPVGVMIDYSAYESLRRRLEEAGQRQADPEPSWGPI